MSQYLSHIAALTLNRIEPVLPRLNSRFEAPLEFAPPAELAFVQEARDFQSAQQASLQKSVADRTAAHEFVDEPFNKASEMQGRTDEMETVQLDKPEPSAGESPSVREFHSLAVEPAYLIEQSVMQAPQDIHQDAPPEERAQIESVPQRFTEQTHRELIIREMARFQSNQTIIQVEEPKRALTVKPADIELSHPSSGLDADRPNRLTLGQNQVETSQPRTVHVSIGRIEIRAHQADKPKEKPRTASKTMSLDDYLKQRGRA